MRQDKRFIMFEKFSQSRKGAVLMTTNVSERGLDFPAVDWVVQFDSPKTVDDYIHRVGRTARCGQAGRTVIFLLPSESMVVDSLVKMNISIKEFKIGEDRIERRISKRGPELVAGNPELSFCARLAFQAYLRDYCFKPKENKTKNKNPALKFDPAKIVPGELAISLCLPQTPELPDIFVKAVQKSSKKQRSDNRKDAMKPVFSEMDVNIEEGFLSKKQTLDIIDTNEDVLNTNFSKKGMKKKSLQGNEKSKHTALENYEGETSQSDKDELEGPLDIEAEKARLKSVNAADKVAWRDLVRAKHRKDKIKLKEKRQTKPSEDSELSDESSFESNDEDSDESGGQESEKYSESEDDQPVLKKKRKV